MSNIPQENVEKFHVLGGKTLFMLILKKSYPFFIFLIPLVMAPFFFDQIPAQYHDIAINVILGYAALLLIMLLWVFFIGWLEYFRYRIFVDDKTLRIRRGLLATEEIGIPYRRIRDVITKRSIIAQIFGVSDLVVILSEFEDKENQSEESTIYLPALDKEVAIEIQDGILKKAQVEQINVVSGPNIK